MLISTVSQSLAIIEPAIRYLSSMTVNSRLAEECRCCLDVLSERFSVSYAKVLAYKELTRASQLFPESSLIELGKPLTYIHNWSLVRIMDLVSHTTYIACVILYISGGTYSLSSTPNDRFFWETFHGSSYQKSAERKSPKKCFLYFVLILGLGLEP